MKIEQVYSDINWSLFSKHSTCDSRRLIFDVLDWKGLKRWKNIQKSVMKMKKVCRMILSKQCDKTGGDKKP